MQNAIEDIRLLLVTRDRDVEEEVLRACRESNVLTLVGTVARADEAASVARQRRARVILLDASVLDDVERVIMDVSLAAPECFLFALVPEGDLDLAQRSLLAGARGFITKPVKAEELSQTIVRVLTLDILRRSEVEKDARRENGEIITVMGVKGGVGRTVLAANLAVALHRQSKAPVLIVEATTLPGDLAAVFAATPPFSLMDILAAGSDIDLPSLFDIIPKHSSGVHILPGALDYEGPQVDASRLRGFLRLARQVFRFIVVDTGELQDPFTEIVTEEADRLLLVTSPDLLALHRLVKFYNALVERANVDPKRITIVLNMTGLLGGVRKEAVEQLLRDSIRHVIPHEPDIVMESVRKGIPFVALKARSDVAQGVQRLADDLLAGGDNLSNGERSVSTTGLLNRLRNLLETSIQPAAQSA